MTNKQLADKLELHQKWRRGDLEEMPMEPKELGLVIDEVIERLRDDRMRAMLEELFDVFKLCTRQAIARWVKNGCNIRLARECASKNIEYARKIKKLLKEVKGETKERTEHARDI